MRLPDARNSVTAAAVNAHFIGRYCILIPGERQELERLSLTNKILEFGKSSFSLYSKSARAPSLSSDSLVERRPEDEGAPEKQNAVVVEWDAEEEQRQSASPRFAFKKVFFFF